MQLTEVQTLVIIAMGVLGTIITRFLPFVIFKSAGAQHPFVTYLGRVLPYAAVGLLVVYCLKGVSFTQSPFGIPEAIAIAVIALLHFWKSNVLLSIGAGTALYMVLVQFVFR